MIAGRTASRRGFSIVEALVAFGLVVLALAGVFEVMPYTYRTLQEDSLRAEAATAAQRYLEGVRLAVQTGSPFPSPTVAPLVFQLKTSVDAFATYEFTELPGQPVLDLIAGPAASWKAIVPSLVVAGEPHGEA